MKEKFLRANIVNYLLRELPFVLRASFETVFSTYLLVIIPALAVYFVSSSKNAAAALSVGNAVKVGTGLWSLGLGGAYTWSDAGGDLLTLPLLGLTGLQIFFAWVALRRACVTKLATGALYVCICALLTLFLLLVAGQDGYRILGAVLGMTVLSAVVAFAMLQRRGQGIGKLSQWWQLRPPWVSPALKLARDMALVGLAASVLVVIAAGIAGASRVSRLHDVLATGGFISSAGLILLQLGWLPTLLVWALSWLVGPGFSVGAGTMFAPDSVVAGAVPALPLLGLLPTQAVGGQGAHWGLYLPLTLTVCALVVGWCRRRSLRQLTLAQTVITALAATALLAVAGAVLCLLSSGSLGSGRLTRVGPACLMTVLLLALEVGIGLLVGAVLIHPCTWRFTERGVRTTASTVGGAAQAVRAGFEKGASSLQARVHLARDRGQEPNEIAAESTADAEATESAGKSPDDGETLAAEPKRDHMEADV